MQTGACLRSYSRGGGRVVRWCWVIFQCRGVLLVWKRVGQGPTVLAVGAGGGDLDIFSLIYHFSVLSPSLLETARYRLKYCLKGPLSPNNQPTNLTPETKIYSVCKMLLVALGGDQVQISISKYTHLLVCKSSQVYTRSNGVVGWCYGPG